MRIGIPRRLSDITIDTDLDMATAAKDILLGGQLLKTTNLALREVSSSELAIRNAGDTVYKSIRGEDMRAHDFIGLTLSNTLQTKNQNSGEHADKGRDDGVGLATVSEIIGAATTYRNLIFSRLRLDDVLATLPEYLVKGSDETVNNSNTYQNDDDLVLAVGANEIYEMIIFIFYNSGATPDFKRQWTVPTGGALKGTTHDKIGQIGANGTPLVVQDGSYAYNYTGTGADALIMEWYVYIGGGNAGNVQLQWAQAVADASDTKVLKGSCILARRVA